MEVGDDLLSKNASLVFVPSPADGGSSTSLIRYARNAMPKIINQTSEHQTTHRRKPHQLLF
jgi:hypothetical protein